MTGTSEHIYKLASEYFTDNTSSCCVTFSKLINAIKVVKGIPVNADLRIVKRCASSNNYKYIFNLDSSKIYVSSCNDCITEYNLFSQSYDSEELSSETISSFLLSIKDSLSKLEFNNFIGCFVKDQEVNEDYLGLDIFDNEYMESNDCCVCMEKTITQTNCSHSLCVQCWSKLKKDECPICRMDNIFITKINEDCNDSDYEYNYHESDYESESDNESYNESNNESDNEPDNEPDNESDNESDNEPDNEPDNESDNQVSIINLDNSAVVDYDSETVWETDSELE